MDKFICKHCNFLLTIKKIINNKMLNNPNDLLYAIKNPDQIYELKFDKSILETFLDKKEIKDVDKKKYLKFFDLIYQKKNLANIYLLHCSTCGSEYNLEPETIIYTLNLKNQEIMFDDDDIDLKLYDNTLPRTKDYICINKMCETNQENFNTINKEAVIYRAKSSYISKYGCVN